MSENDTHKMPELVEKLEALKEALESEGEKGRAQLQNIKEVLQQILHTKDGGILDPESQRKLYSQFSHVLADLETPSESEAATLKQPCGYGSALIATSILLPVAAAVFTMVIVLVQPHIHFRLVYTLAPVWGALGALAVWLVLSALCCRIADARYAIPSSHGELLPRLDELEASLKGFRAAAGPGNNPCMNTAYHAAVKQYNGIRKDLGTKGLSWALATGYSKVWGRLYRAEEALIEFAPHKKVLESALYDEARLEGSEVPNREDLLAKLRKAVIALDPSAQKYLKSTAAVTLPPALAIGTATLPGGMVGGEYSQALLALGGVPPYRWTVIGTTPDALLLSPEGVLHGTPTKEGHSSLAIRATDSAGATAEKGFDLVIGPSTKPALLTVSPTLLPAGTVGIEYVERLCAAGGTPPYKWKLTEGKIPEGISWSDTGLLRGTPTADKTYEFTVEVTDSSTTATSAPSMKLTLPIRPSTIAAAMPVGGIQQELNARGVLSNVRSCINEYRNSRWNGLILARNRLLATFTLTSMVVFALLAIAIMAGAKRPAIIAATVFYLVGATVGLCNRLRSMSQAESAVPDYGLSAARLIILPLFSGLGAIGGVLLVAYLPLVSPLFQPSSTPATITVPKDTPKQSAPEAGPGKGATPKPSTPADGTTENVPPRPSASGTGSTQRATRMTPTPVAGTAPQATPTQGVPGADAGKKAAPKPPTPAASATQDVPPGPSTPEVPSKSRAPAGGGQMKQPKIPQTRLEAIFDLNKNLVGIFVAMVFGLTPGLLFDHLQQQADKYKADLKSSQSTSATQKS